MKGLINHCEIFLNHDHFLNDDIRAHISAELGIINFYLGDYEKAKILLEHPLINLKEGNAQTARILCYLGNVYRGLGEYKIAQELLEKSIRFYQEYFPHNYPKIADSLAYLGTVYRSLREN